MGDSGRRCTLSLQRYSQSAEFNELDTNRAKTEHTYSHTIGGCGDYIPSLRNSPEATNMEDNTSLLLCPKGPMGVVTTSHKLTELYRSHSACEPSAINTSTKMPC